MASQDHAPSITAVTSGQSHTPGPWEVRWRFGRLTTVSGRQRFPICDTGTAPLAQANNRREEANARLIAAAPELLTSLQAMLGWFGGADPEDIEGNAILDAAIAAVAKAEARSDAS